MNTLADRLWPRCVEKGTCWVWSGAADPSGYGRIRGEDSILYVHRAAYELWVGRIPAGLTIDHLCRNRLCCNPAHLEAVTMRENLMRGAGPSAVNARKTHCVHNHALSGSNLYLWRGERHCRTCRSLHRHG